MNVRVLKCPECGANIEIEDDLKSCFCKYCGCQLFLDEGKQEYTINKNINVNKTVHKRYTDDADVIRAKNEGDEARKAFRQVLIIWGIIFAIFIAVVLGFQIYKAAAQRNGKVNAGYYKDLIGKDYETVEAHFKAAGFTNIRLIDLDNSGIAFWNDGKVDTISIGGDIDFDSIDWFSPDAEVIISYN